MSCHLSAKPGEWGIPCALNFVQTVRRLEPVLQDWSRVLPGYHLYYPHRHRASTALQALRDMIVAEQRQRGDSRNATFDRPQG